MRSWFWTAGRLRRKPYWFILWALLAADWLVHAAATMIATSQPSLLPYAGVAVLLSTVLAGWISVCSVTRRLHDVNRSGWWQVLPITAASVGFALAEPAWAAELGIGEAGAALALNAAYGVYIGFLVVMGLIRGTGPNRFDPYVAADAF